MRTATQSEIRMLRVNTQVCQKEGGKNPVLPEEWQAWGGSGNSEMSKAWRTRPLQTGTGSGGVKLGRWLRARTWRVLEHLSKVTAQGFLSTDVTVRSVCLHKRTAIEDGLVRSPSQLSGGHFQGLHQGLAERGLSLRMAG